MPFYRYTARDQYGKPVSGALDAPTPDDARTRRIRMALMDVSVEAPNALAATPSSPNRTPAPPATPPHRPIPSPRATPVNTPAPRPATGASPLQTPRSIPQEATAPPDAWTLPIAPPKERSFFFDQLGRFLNSGIAPSRALETLADQKPGRAGEFLRNASRRVALGTGLGESLRGGYITEAERDALTASERGGYVPQACVRLSDLAMDAHRLSRGFAYPLVMIGLGLFAGPCTRGVQDASFRAIVAQDRAGGSLSPMGTLTREWGKTAPGTVPLGLLYVGLFFLAIWIWNRPFNRRTRHAIVRKLWPLSSRARSEGTSQLASHLAALSSAGIPAHESARLAGATIPNLLLREEANCVFANLATGTPLSGAIARSNLVSDQYRDMVANGELTGDVPGALSTVARVEESEYVNRSKFAGRGLYAMLSVVSAIFIGIYLGFAAKYWYANLIKLFTSGELSE